MEMIWVYAALGGMVLGVVIFFVLIMFSKKSNIDYMICQSFLGNQKWYRSVGMVDIKNDGTFMAEHIITEGGKRHIGTFHQKHLKPGRGNRYFMFLEEWDLGRFRPLEYRGQVKGKTEVIKKVPKIDENGKILRDNKGNIQFDDITEVIDVGTFKSIPNHDIDWIMARKEKNRLLLLRKEEKHKWLPVIAGGVLFIIIAVCMVIVGFYLSEFSDDLREASKNFNEQAHSAKTASIIKEILLNETMRDIVKENANSGGRPS